MTTQLASQQLLLFCSVPNIHAVLKYIFFLLQIIYTCNVMKCTS
jgi:hypothetical protein